MQCIIINSWTSWAKYVERVLFEGSELESYPSIVQLLLFQCSLVIARHACLRSYVNMYTLNIGDVYLI